MQYINVNWEPKYERKTVFGIIISGTSCFPNGSIYFISSDGIEVDQYFEGFIS